MPADSIMLPDGNELLRRLEANNGGGSLTMFLPYLPKLAGQSCTPQGLVMELTLAVATYARGDKDATKAGFLAMPLVIDALIDDEQARTEVKAHLRTALKP
jgi:hypothetical protein